MLPPRDRQRPRLHSGVELRDPDARADGVDADEAISPEDERRRRAYAEWLAGFESRHAAA
jgi:hypothetical protein